MKPTTRRFPCFSALLLTVFASCLVILAACSNGAEEPVGTASSETNAPSETEPSDADRSPKQLTGEDGAPSFRLRSLTSETILSVRDNVLYFDSLKTESGREKAAGPSVCRLPSLDADKAWTYVGADPYDDSEGGVGFILHFTCGDLSLTYDFYAVARPALAGPFEFFGYIENGGSEALSFRPRSYFSFTAAGDGDPTAWTFHKESGIAEGFTLYWTDPEGVTYEGSGIYHTVLSKGRKAFSVNKTDSGWNANGNIPMIYVDYGTDGVYYALEWTNGRLSAEGKGDHTAALSVSLGDTEFAFLTEIPAGGTFFCPSVYLGAYDGDVDDGSNVYKRWFLRYKAPANMRDNPCEPLTQVDALCSGETAKYWGFEALKWDIAWWNETGLWTSYKTLEVRNPHHLSLMETEGASTLAEYTAALKKNGVSLTTYLLLRDLKTTEPGEPSSIGPEAHPEWFGGMSGSRSSRIAADLGDPACVAFYQRYFENFFKTSGAMTWRSDFEPILGNNVAVSQNRHVDEGGSDITYWCTVGFGELVDYLTENVPGFRYESCSEGGSMKDIYTMTKASVLNCDDCADFMSLHMSFYDASYCIHPAQIQLPTVTGSFIAGNERSTPASRDYLYGMRCSLVGGVMLNFHGETNAEHEACWPYYVGDLYRNVMRPLIRNGDLYHILPRPDGVHWDGLQYVDPESENEVMGMVLLWKPTDTEGPQKTVKLRGLEPGARYQLTFEDRTEQNAVYIGRDLMETGLTVTIEGDFGSEMIWISRAS